MEVRTHDGQEATASALGHVDSDDVQPGSSLGQEDVMPRGNDDLTVLRDVRHVSGDESNDRHQQPGQHTGHKPHQHERDADNNNNNNNAPQATGTQTDPVERSGSKQHHNG